MSLWTTGDTAYAYKLNKMGNIGVDEEKGSPTTMGEAYIALDTLIVYVSLDGTEWTHQFTLEAVP